MGIHQEEINSVQSQPQSLARESSLYNLTLDEVQTHLSNLGKPLGSMNLDELLKNVESTTDAALQPTLSAVMSHKTVDQVWTDIQKNHQEQQRELALGQITLEDFLVKAGVAIRAPSDKTKDISVATPSNFTQQRNQWLHFQLPLAQRQSMMGAFPSVPQPLAMRPNPHLEVTYPENQITIAAPSLMGKLSDSQITGCKRAATGGATEKTTERRQKRMIKNRESAARSRKKKQEYTTELEIKISCLEEENERLRKKKELKKMLQRAAPPEPKLELRRTTSAKF